MTPTPRPSNARILVIHNEYTLPGGERAAVRAQIELLRSRGHHVVTLVRSNKDLHTATATKRTHLGMQTLFSISTYRAVRELVRREKPDIAHVHNVFPLVSPSAYVALKRAGIPIVQTLHNFRFMCPNGLFFTQQSICERCKFGRYHNAVRFKCYKGSSAMSALMAGSIGLNRKIGALKAIDKAIALNRFVASKFIESGIFNREQIAVIPQIPVSRPDRYVDFGGRKDEILYLGRLSREKGVDIAIEAMKQLPSNSRLLIAGTGPMRDALSNQVKDMRVNNVRFLGYLSGDAKWDYLLRSKVMVVPSLMYEHFPVVIMEAMAAGTPVVASDHGSLPHIVKNDQTGLLFVPGDTKDLARKCNQLLRDEPLWTRMSTTARSVLNSEYSMDAHYKSLMGVYSQLL